MPLGFDSMAPQHSTPKVGGDTFRDNSAKKNLLIESWLLRISLLCQKMDLLVSSSQNRTISVVPFLKLQPNPISVRLALTRRCMANSSHSVRMDPLF